MKGLVQHVSSSAFAGRLLAPASKLRRLVLIAVASLILSTGGLAVQTQTASASVPASVQLEIYNFAVNQPVGATCDHYSTAWCNYSGGWCAAFATYIWSHADSRIDTTGLGASVSYFTNYLGGSTREDYTPHDGDAVVFRDSQHNTGLHVGIITSVSGGYIYTEEGNMSGAVHQLRYGVGIGSQGYVRLANGSYSSSPATSEYGYPLLTWHYMAPALWAPTAFTVHAYTGGGQWFSWNSSYNPDTFWLLRNGVAVPYSSGMAGSSRTWGYDYPPSGSNTYQLCAVTGGIARCAPSVLVKV